jgi:hypothetical protein
LRGKKWLYAHAYYTESEFWSIYYRKDDALRQKYHASYLPSIYDKIKVGVAIEKKAINESWALWILGLFWSILQVRGQYGVWKAFRGGDYFLPPKNLRESKTKVE